MISTLSGKVAEKLAEVVVIDVAGVGYGVYTTVEDYGSLKTGEPTKVYIYEHIRENIHDLFAFTSLDAKKLFELLLNVNGVGPKMALNILSIGSLNDVRRSIAAGEVKYIQSANGVGKKVAERVIVELKDKIGLESTLTEGVFLSSQAAQKDEAVQALVSLGFSTSDALSALDTVPKDLTTEQRIKQALKGRA